MRTSTSRLAEIEEHEIATSRRMRVGLRSRLGGWIDCLHALQNRLRVAALPLRLVARPEKLKLFDCLCLAIELRELIGEHQTDVILPRTEIGEFLKRSERFIEVAGLLHAVGVLEEVLFGVADESLVRADLPEGVVDRRATGRMAQDLVTEGDRIVV